MKTQRGAKEGLELVVWSFSGAWSLELGAWSFFPRFMQRTDKLRLTGLGRRFSVYPWSNACDWNIRAGFILRLADSQGAPGGPCGHGGPFFFPGQPDRRQWVTIMESDAQTIRTERRRNLSGRGSPSDGRSRPRQKAIKMDICVYAGLTPSCCGK
jgi:hypothetical protein